MLLKGTCSVCNLIKIAHPGAFLKVIFCYYYFFLLLGVVLEVSCAGGGSW